MAHMAHPPEPRPLATSSGYALATVRQISWTPGPKRYRTKRYRTDTLSRPGQLKTNLWFQMETTPTPQLLQPPLRAACGSPSLSYRLQKQLLVENTP